MAYGPILQRYIEPARATPQLWRLLVGIIVMGVVYFLVVVAIMFGVMFGLGINEMDWLVSSDALQRPWTVLWLLSTFLGMALAPVAAAALLHRRGPGTLFGRAPRVVRELALTFGVFLILGGAPVVIWILISDMRSGLALGVWLSFLPLALTGIALQTLAEELVFRGYLLQQLAARFASPFIWMGLPSLAFGLLHFDPSLGAIAAVGVIFVTTCFGLVAADLTARTGSLGAAWGFHFANNLLAMLILSVDGRLSGLALFRADVDLSAEGFPVWLFAADAVLIVLGWIVVRRLLAR